jgi:hypothetical protein
MGRKREITQEEAETLHGLGFVIHYSYDPDDTPGKRRQNGLAAAGLPKGRTRRSPAIKRGRCQRLLLTGLGMTKKRRKLAKTLTVVFDAANPIMLATNGESIDRKELANMVAAVVGKTEKAVQCQLSHLLHAKLIKVESHA